MDSKEDLHLPIPVPTYGGSIVEEEIPPHWEKIPHHLQDTGGEHMTQESLEIPLIIRSWA
jgi:hypothetical protein